MALLMRISCLACKDILWDSQAMEANAATAGASAVRFPRMLLGAALIFWGWMVDLPLAGLALAFLFEGPHWLPQRWNFGETAYVRAWSISVIAMMRAQEGRVRTLYCGSFTFRHSEFFVVVFASRHHRSCTLCAFS
jgi:hypothetical protein